MPDPGREPEPETASVRGRDLLTAVRRQRPRVHCIVNEVAAPFTANALLALGATPSMTWSEEEVADFVVGADALCINLGTLSSERRGAITAAVRCAGADAIPWVLDPVFVQRSPRRLRLARELLLRRPAVIKANSTELRVLMEEPAAMTAAQGSCVLWRTGAVDEIEHSHAQCTVANGHSLMERVSGVGCAAGAVLAALLGIGAEPFEAAVVAALIMGVAGELAAGGAGGPGQFQVALLDALHGLDGVELQTRARVNERAIES